MAKFTKIAGTDNCPNSPTCPGAWSLDVDPDGVYVQGDRVAPELLAQLEGIPDHETLVRYPRELWEKGRA